MGIAIDDIKYLHKNKTLSKGKMIKTLIYMGSFSLFVLQSARAATEETYPQAWRTPGNEYIKLMVIQNECLDLEKCNIKPEIRIQEESFSLSKADKDKTWVERLNFLSKNSVREDYDFLLVQYYQRGYLNAPKLGYVQKVHFHDVRKNPAMTQLRLPTKKIEELLAKHGNQRFISQTWTGSE